MKKVITLIILLKSINFIYNSYIGILNNAYFVIGHLQLDKKLYYLFLLMGIILFAYSIGMYIHIKPLIILTKFVLIVDILYSIICTLFITYSVLILANISFYFFSIILLINIINGCLDFYVLKQVENIS